MLSPTSSHRLTHHVFLARQHLTSPLLASQQTLARVLLSVNIGRNVSSHVTSRPNASSKRLSRNTLQSHLTARNMSSGEAEAASKPEAGGKATPELPPLSRAEFQQFNHMSVKMDAFHNHFRQTWNLLYTGASTGRRPHGMTLRQFIEQGLMFIRQLTMHHNIEEQMVFPMLARKMPEFRSGSGGGKAELLRQHREIHKGMDGFEEYLRSCKTGERDFEMGALKEQMDSWGTVLWTHLDQEVKTLGAENMRKYWTLEEVKGMIM